MQNNESKCKIKKIKAKIIKDSRGNPTVEAEVITDSGKFRASVPSGASRGRYEAKSAAAGSAAANIKKIIAPALEGKSFSGQKEVDDFLIRLDGTSDKSRLGANAILAVSMAACRANAAARKIPLYRHIADFVAFRGNLHSLPRPCFNIINGGAHAKNKLDIQEFMVAPATTSVRNNLDIGIKIYKKLGQVLEKKFGAKNAAMGDEGGFAPLIGKTEEALDFLVAAAGQAGCGDLVMFGLDCAASQFFRDGGYFFEGEKMDSGQLLGFYKKIAEEYPILFLEDPFGEDDWPAWRKTNSEIKKIFAVGDDLLASNPERMKKARLENACDAMILKPNQIGSVSEAVEAGRLARQFGWKIIVSHRSGETTDDFIADLAVGIGADFIKSGAPGPVERMAKYRRLLLIEKQLTPVRPV